MASSKINIEEFLSLARSYPVFDVRSPGEFKHAHLPQAYSLPLFSDDERSVVGTAYKRESRGKAIKLGLDYFGGKMKKMIEEVEEITKNQQSNNKIVLVHCWRGGMRSSAIAWLLDLYGFKVYTLIGGYKAYRHWVLNQFEKPYEFSILGGFTGSGKTIVLEQLQRLGNRVINLEGLANHKGSAFGAIGEKPQPGQEMFENLFANELFFQNNLQLDSDDGNNIIWLEDESQRIGSVLIPNSIWNGMRGSPVFFMDISFEERLKYLVSTYGIYDREKLVNSIMRVQKKLGGLETKNAINYLLENNISASFRILLQYYDKLYTKGLNSRKDLDQLLHRLSFNRVDSRANSLEIHDRTRLASNLTFKDSNT